MPDSRQGASPISSPILLLEHWKPVVGWEGLYEISNAGSVWSVRTKIRLRMQLSVHGYYCAHLILPSRKKLAKVHQLVAEAFIGPRPIGLQINHCDGKKLNNRRSNLEYTTAAENTAHAHRSGLIPRFRRINTKFTDEEIRIIRGTTGAIGNKAMAKCESVSVSVIRKIRDGETYKFVR